MGFSPPVNIYLSNWIISPKFWCNKFKNLWNHQPSTILSLSIPRCCQTGSLVCQQYCLSLPQSSPEEMGSIQGRCGWIVWLVWFTCFWCLSSERVELSVSTQLGSTQTLWSNGSEPSIINQPSKKVLRFGCGPLPITITTKILIILWGIPT